MKQRLIKFGIGLLLGIMLSYAFFSDHDWTSWMPNGRILYKIQTTTEYPYSDKVNCQIKHYKINDKQLSGIYQEGDVDFGASKTREEPREYLINYIDSTNQTIQGRFKLYGDTLCRLVSLKILGYLEESPCK